MRKYLADEQRDGKPIYESIFDSILYKCFAVDVKSEEPDNIKVTLAQSTERENFDLDREVKTSMVNAFYEVFPELLTRQEEVNQMIDRYYQYLPTWAEGYRARKSKK